MGLEEISVPAAAPRRMPRGTRRMNVGARLAGKESGAGGGEGRNRGRGE